VLIGFTIHRWWAGGGWGDGAERIERAEALAAFVRTGLRPPPHEPRPLTDVEEQGRKIFEDVKVGCTQCHAAKTEYTNRALSDLGKWPVNKERFDEESGDWKFKVPSLLFVGGTAPYYHDGSAPTLEALIDQNGSRMGNTGHLSKDQRAALVAFLRTL
jgi:cytochrome c peroxidase